MAREGLTRQDWAAAALRALARGGAAEVRVEALARELGATRGSFYWHFTDRRAVLVAALEEWERQCTTDLIADASGIAEPAERLRFLLTEAVGDELVVGLEPAIAGSDDPDVAAVAGRVAAARLSFVTRIYRDLGLGPAEARRRAILAYATLLGLLQLRRSVSEVVPEAARAGRPARLAMAYVLDELVHAPGR